VTDKELDIVLKHVGDAAGEAAQYKGLFKRMCGYYCSLMDGDTHHVEDAYALMKEHGIVDEDGEEIYEEEDE
jgi:hypothetical protein